MCKRLHETDGKLKGKFKSKGLDSGETKPTMVRFPSYIEAMLREMENRSEFIREAVREKLERESLY